MRTVKKADLAAVLIRDLKTKGTLAHRAVDVFVASLTDALIRGNRIEIRDFGVWTVKTTRPKPEARNPRTGERVFVPARRKVTFKPGRLLKKALSQPLEEQRTGQGISVGGLGEIRISG